MSYLAHRETGKFLDVRQSSSVEDYRSQFPGVDTTGWQIVAVSGPSVEGTDAPVQAVEHEWTAYEFKLRLTQAERMAIRAAAQQSPEVFDFMDLLDTAAACGKMVVSNDPVLKAGIDALADAGLLSSDRKIQILGG